MPARAAACPDGELPYVPGVNDAQVQRGVLCLVNNERLARGLRPLVANARLDLSARRHLADMAARGFDGHIAPDPAPFGATPHERAAAAGYPGTGAPWEVGETLHAVSQSTPIASPELTTARATVTAWMESTAHCEVLLTREAVDLGVGVLRSSDELGWVTDTFAVEVGVPGLTMTPAPACSGTTGLVAPEAVPDAPVVPRGAEAPAVSGVALGTTGVVLASGASIKLRRAAAAAPLTLRCARTSGRCRATATLRVKGRSLGWARGDFTAGSKLRLTVPIARTLRKTLTRRRTRATLTVQAAGRTSSRVVTLRG
jgi:uncharacterized protein YkwD